MNPLALAAACDAQGQELFAPPNVEGWAGGPVWINSATLLERGNWAADIVWGRAENGLAPFDPLAWAARYEITPDQAAEALVDLLLQDDLGDEARAWSSKPAATAPRTDCAKSSNESSTAPSSNWPETPITHREETPMHPTPP